MGLKLRSAVTRGSLVVKRDSGAERQALVGTSVLEKRYYLHPLVVFFLIVSGTILTGYPSSFVATAVVNGSVLCLGLVLVSGFSRGTLGPFIGCLAICYLTSGVSAIYSNVLGDPAQQTLDARYFYEMATRYRPAQFTDVLFIENGGAIALWQIFYILFDWLGIKITPHIGIAVNSLLVSLSCVVGVRIVSLVFEDDAGRKRSFFIRFSLCGLFWLFASIHLRDAVILLSVSLLVHHWVSFFRRASPLRFVMLLVLSFGWSLILQSLRSEYIYLPLGFCGAGVAAWLFSYRKSPSPLKILSLFLLGGGILYFWMTQSTEVSIFSELQTGRESYANFGRQEGGSSSLGATLIENKEGPVRLVLGALYMFVFPVPVWSGFQLESAYHLFKSLHALFMYYVTPIFVLGLHRLVVNATLRRNDLLFLAMSAVGFSIAIGYSSLETRHFGPFILPIIIISLLPQGGIPEDRESIRRWVRLYFLGICVLHCAWAALKYGL